MVGSLSSKSQTVIIGNCIMKPFFQRRHGQTSLSMQPFNTGILLCIFIFTTLLLQSSVSHAHGLYVSLKEGQLHAAFSDRSPASGAVVTVVDEDGIAIVRGALNEKGTWTLPKDIEGEPKFVIVEASGGHLTRIAWQEVLHGTSKGFFDYLSVRIAIGVLILGGGGFIIKRILIPKSQIRNPK